MLSEQQLISLKNELLNQKKQLDTSEEETSIQDNNIRDTTGELSLYDNHPADLGTELFEREKDMALSIHSESQLDKVMDAIQALEAGTYGVCEVCKQDIPFERLEAIPYTTRCVEHAIDQELPTDRPIEEEVLHPPMDNSFADRPEGSIKDYEDSFQDVAQFGTSETPSDFEGDYDSYNKLYDDDAMDGFTEDYETFTATDISGEERIVYQSEQEREYAEKLDDAGVEAPFGDVPYKWTDGYVDDDEQES
jgi:YteA family regulatory protein